MAAKKMLVQIFPGQGAQAVGMCADLLDLDAEVTKAVLGAEEQLGRPLWNIIRRGPRACLIRTDIQQPAVCLTSAISHDVAKRAGLPRPAMVAGHSLGELSASYAAGAMDLRTLMSLADQRGRSMAAAAAASPGGMAAIAGADEGTLFELIEDAGRAGPLALANRNSPAQYVVSGSEAALARCSEICGSRGLRLTRLDVSGPWHSPAMRPAAEAFSKALDHASIEDPMVPIVSAMTSKPLSDKQTLREILVRQMVEPVDWVETVARLDGACPSGHWVETGPGRTLSGLLLAFKPPRIALRIGDRKTLSTTLRHFSEP